MLQDLKTKLSRTRRTLKTQFDEFLASGRTRDELLEELAETLILADAGVTTTEKIIERIRQKSRKTDSFSTIRDLLEEEITNILTQEGSNTHPYTSPYAVMMVGVNGGGKTTSVAKLAFRFQQQGRRVLMVAADTFRAAAKEQLSFWGKKLGIPVLSGQYGADPAAVVFDAIQSLKARESDVLLVDTAGRIHTNINLMNELEKIKRVMAREIEGAPHEVLLVLDASIGQNALVQAKAFLKFSGLTGVFLTKVDGTAKGGSVLSITEELRLPIKFLGTGEGEKDLLDFSPEEFAKALLS